MRVLVTGASGFVGRSALEALARRGVELHAVSHHEPRADLQYVWHRADLLDHDRIRAVVNEARPDVILHLAWIVEHGAFWTSPQNLDWVGASLALARAGAENGIQRFVGVGTCYEYEWPQDGDCSEFETPLRPSTLYGECKDATRRAIEAFSVEAGFSFVWARLFFLYGLREGPGRLIPAVARALAANKPVMCTSGVAIRDFMDVRDAGEALASLALSDLVGQINIATGEGIKIADIVRKLGALSGRAELLQMGALPDRLGEPQRIVANVNRLNTELGFRPARSLDDGLCDAYKYWVAKEASAAE